MKAIRNQERQINHIKTEINHRSNDWPTQNGYQNDFNVVTSQIEINNMFNTKKKQQQ